MTVMMSALAGLRQMIASGALAPGQQFPPEAELCRELDVSRSSLREAVRVLATVGVIEVRHGSGTYVSQLNPADIIRGFSLTVDLLPLEGLLQLFEIRRVLEGNAAAQAAARAPEELVARLSDLCDRMEASSDGDVVAELDDQFHEAICAAAGNATVTSLISVLRSRGRHYRIFDSGPAAPAKRASDEGHRAIVDALARRDPAAATAAASVHVARTEYWLTRLQPTPEA
ncbi:FadR/GntR family transcriptional regulator [Microbacterium sp. RD1]|uniref:FadR/GntR family transcriptional regulator n=1 Tax=Microbacterium sp. RD1 TaxID=3457313 RepID=UPI003FA576E0